MTIVEVIRSVDAPEGLLLTCQRLVLDAFDDDFSADDWAHALGGFHVVATDGPTVVSHAAVVPRVLEVGGRSMATGYVEAVATAPGRQGQGLGSLVMAAAGRVVRSEFELGALSTGHHHFYERLGWRRWRGPTFVRRGDRLERTPEEDDGVMVLVTETAIDLTAPITCDERPGDDW